MNKIYIVSLLAALACPSINGAVVTINAAPVTVTVTAGHARAAASSVISSGGYPSSASSAPSSVSSSSVSSSGSSASVPSSGSVSSGSGSLNISQDEFINAWTQGKQYLPDPNIPAPTIDQYNAFIKNAGPMGGITSKTELAMFLSEIMWESGGLYYKSELACQTNNCAGQYVDAVGLPGKYYYGRGYIQLSWGANYKEASNELFNDDRLLQNPDTVATNEDYAWDASLWYWKAKVRPTLAGTFNFGLATKAINGALECSGSNTDKAKKRFQIYTAILKVFEPSATPIEAGCYN